MQGSNHDQQRYETNIATSPQQQQQQVTTVVVVADRSGGGEPVDVECPVCLCVLNDPVVLAPQPPPALSAQQRPGDSNTAAATTATSASRCCGHSVCRRDGERVWAHARAWSRAPPGALLLNDVSESAAKQNIAKGATATAADTTKSSGAGIVCVRCPACDAETRIQDYMDDVSTPDAPRSCWKSNESLQQAISALHEKATSQKGAECVLCKDESVVWQCQCTHHSHSSQKETKQWFVCDDCIGGSKKRHLKKFSVPPDLVKLTGAGTSSEAAGCTSSSSSQQVTALVMVKDRDVCSTHHEPLKRFCIECQESVCWPCLVDGEHKNKQSDLQHKNKPIEEAALEKVKELKSLSEELTSKQRCVKSTIDTVQRSEVFLSVSAKQAISEVVSTQEKAVELIMKKSEQLINQITLESLSKGKELSRQKELLECHLQTIEEEHKTIEIMIGIGTGTTMTTDNHKVVRVFPRLKSRARCVVDAPIVLGEPCLVPCVQFVPSFVDDLLVLCSHFGDVLSVSKNDFRWQLDEIDSPSRSLPQRASKTEEGNYSNKGDLNAVSSRRVNTPLSFSVSLSHTKSIIRTTPASSNTDTATTPESNNQQQLQEQMQELITAEVWEDHESEGGASNPTTCGGCEVSCCCSVEDTFKEEVMKKWKVNVVPKKEGTFKMNILCGNKPINTLPIRFSAFNVPKTPNNIRIGSITHEGFQFTCDFIPSPVVLGTTMNGIKHNDSVIVEIAQKTKQGEGAPTLKGHTTDVDTVQWEEVYCGVENTCTIGGGSSTPTNQAKGVVKADTEYIVRCCLCDHLGCGDWVFAPHSVRTLPDPAPLAPINVRIVTQQQGPATLEWTPNPHGPRPSSFVIQSRRISNHNPHQQLETQPTEEGWAQAGITKSSQQQEPPTSMDITPEMVNSGGSGVEFRVGALNGPSASSPWSNVALFKRTFTWEPSSCYKTNLSDSNHIATGVSGNEVTTVWTTQCITTGSVAVARITLIKKINTSCGTPCIGVVGPAITSTPPSGCIYNKEGFWGFNLGNRDNTWHNGKQQPNGDSRNGYDNTPDGTVITVTVDMTHPGGGTMSVRVGDCYRDGVCCSGLPSPLRFAFSACCDHIIKIE
ncbi:hypothetical protein Pelo_17833 [Pelomyxa schiedti]|nr:hypothetical protein Pelo_17833 [Pelomyxa schiedti]